MNGFKSEGLAYIPAHIHQSMINSTVQPYDVLLNITGASIGRVCVAPDEFCPANVNQHVSIIRTKSELLPTYLSHVIANDDFQRYIVEIQAGGTRQALTKSQIQNFPVPLPPLKEQKRIVKLITQRTAAQERARTAALQQLEAIEGLRPSLLRQAFSGAV